jgi:hypothetical protein
MSHFNKSKLSLVYSFVILVLWATYVIIIFSPRPNSIFPNQVSTGILDNRFVMFLFTRYFGLWSGGLVLLLRLLRIIKNKQSFIYIFIGLLNTSLGVLGIFLSTFKQVNIDLLHMFIFNLSIGVIIFIDISFKVHFKPSSEYIRAVARKHFAFYAYFFILLS